MNFEQKTIQVKIQNQVLSIDARFTNVSDFIQHYFEQNSEINSEDILILSESYVTLEIFEVIKKYYEYHNFQPPQISGGTNDVDQLFQNKHDKELMMPISHQMLMRLYQASAYLQITAFRKLCIARFYVDLIFNPSDPKSLKALQDRFPTVGPITIADVEEYKRKYPIFCQHLR